MYKLKTLIYSFVYLFIENTYEWLFITHYVCYITVTPFQLQPAVIMYYRQSNISGSVV